MTKLIIVPVVIGVLGDVSVNYIKRMEVKVRLEAIQKSTMLETARNILSLCGAQELEL